MRENNYFAKTIGKLKDNSSKATRTIVSSLTRLI